MIVYLDTSCLVKIYVEEEGSEEVRRHIAESEIVATSQIAYVELFSALSRKLKEREISRKDFRKVSERFERDWGSLFTINVTESVIRKAAKICNRRDVRAYDAVHISSALTIQDKVGVDALFLSADAKQVSAAKMEKMKVLHI